jgi:PTS system nitrogen regulatory IIA component
MNISELLAPERVDCSREVASKKRAIELLSELLCTGSSDVSQAQVFESLIGRERLGSTGLGHGVAIPHGRIDGLDRPVGAFLKLSEGVDYDAPDHAPVDLLFALLVPQSCTEEHLRILAQLAQIFSDGETLKKLRDCEDGAGVIRLFNQRQTTDAA